MSKTFEEAVKFYLSEVELEVEGAKIYTLAYAKGNNLSEGAQDTLVGYYNQLWEGGEQLEAYCLLRLIFGELSFKRLLKLHESNRLSSAAECSKSYMKSLF